MRFSVLGVCAVLALPPAALGQTDADEVNRRLQGGAGNAVTAPVQDQDRRNGTIHLQGGKGNLPAPRAEPVEPAESAIISVEGWGEAAGAPDTATIRSGVITQAATAREALDANSAAVTRLIATLREAGIAGPDIQTSALSVLPQYVHSDQPDPTEVSRPPRIVGYQVVNSVSVRVRDLGSLGIVLDRAVAIGANTISGVVFAVDDPSALYAEARRKAFGDAVAKAELYAELAAVDLGGIAVISEAAGSVQPQPDSIVGVAPDAAAAIGPVASGDLTFSVAVRVTWMLRPSE